MKELQEIKALLSDSDEARGRAAARLLGGYLPQPLVIRVHPSQKPRVRAWSSRRYRAVGRIFLDAEGRFFHRFRTDWAVGSAVEVRFRFAPLTELLEEDREALLATAFPEVRDQAYAGWSSLSEPERRRLVALGGSWQEAAAALDDTPAEERLATLGYLLSEQAHPLARRDLVCACLRGDLRLPPGTLPWLLSRPGWNQAADHVELARSLVAREPELLQALQDHPSLRVRVRAVELIEESSTLLRWLAGEPHESVRTRILRRLENRTSAFQLVQRLFREKEAAVREAIGWLLVHWSAPHSDWRAFNQALRSDLGRENRGRLKRKLSRLGKLQLANRFLA